MGISFKNWCVANVAIFILIFAILIGVMLAIAPDAAEILEGAGIIVFLGLLAASLVFAAVIATYAYRNFDDVVSRRTKFRHSRADLQTGRFTYWCVSFFFSFLALAAGSFFLMLVVGAIVSGF